MKVFVVREGEYHYSCRVIGVFSDYDSARAEVDKYITSDYKHADDYTWRNAMFYYTIEEFEVK